MMRAGLVLLFAMVLMFSVGCAAPQYIEFVTWYPPKLKFPKGTSLAIIPKGGDPVGTDLVVRKLEKYLSLEDPDKRFKIIEREMLKDIMDERMLAETGMLDKDAEALAKMKMKGVEALLFVTVTRYKSETIQTPRKEKVTEHTSGGGAAFTRRGVTPVAGTVTEERYVDVMWYTARADVEVAFKMVNVGTAEVLVPEAASACVMEELRERVPDESAVREKAVNNCIAQFMKWVGWVGKRERFELAEPSSAEAKAANNLASQGLFPQAEQQYNIALNLAQDARARAAILYNLGLIMEAQGKFAEAKSCYEQSVTLTGGSIRAYGMGIKRVEEKILAKAQPTAGEDSGRIEDAQSQGQ
jgi:tetratricopeptide (TPR) repeat protein